MSNPFDLLDMAVTALILIGTIIIAVALITSANRHIARIAGKTRTRIDDYGVIIVKGKADTILI